MEGEEFDLLSNYKPLKLESYCYTNLSGLFKET
jgi:hypothetical protein